MRVYRISKSRYIEQALSGIGAARKPGRWNSCDRRVAYTSSSVALAMLESLAHMDEENMPNGCMLLGFDVPDAAITTLPEVAYPPGWNRLPYSATVQRVGDNWLRTSGSLALRVPSAIARYEFNLLINPLHARFAEIRRVSLDPFSLDTRLQK
ncbi:RES domain-containing protein [Pseudoxanthomonas indica]|uniref:RES domain-containing protein n=2 Tax=Pseudoxanthomonas indica TaxID=428993 RepID=A0A1T5LDA0_9GAMM|nr:hypothetical protein GCM10007235_02170 [Pseudoxanthomonas indica]SKC73971.1 RES domain-containing protein [Pseudoxanthomonas indica]